MSNAVTIVDRLKEHGACLDIAVVQEHPCLVRAEVVDNSGQKRVMYSGGVNLEMAKSIAALNAYQAIVGSDEHFTEVERNVIETVPPAVNINAAIDAVTEQTNRARFSSTVKPPSGEGHVTLRRATAEDVNTVHELVHALATYENAADSVKATAETYLRDGFQGDKFFYVILAEFTPTDDPTTRIPVGMALFYIIYSTWDSRALYLEDLFVKEQYRGIGLGKTLMVTLAGVCRHIDAARFQWQALDWNEPALSFYASIGAQRTDEWVSLRMYRSTIDKFWQDNVPSDIA